MMTSIDDAKTLARRLRELLGDDGAALTHSRSLELVARAMGYRNWSTFVASADSGPLVVPVLRCFPGSEAVRFYVDYLGFAVDWEHRFEPGMPVYRQLSMAGVVLHLSEHHGDAIPGSRVRIRVPEVAELQQRLRDDTRYPLRIGLSIEDWGSELAVPDPFGNTLVFHTPRVG